MDIFKQRNYLVITVIILIILNVGILVMLWVNKPRLANLSDRPKHKSDEQELISSLLKEELNFSTEQVQKYLDLRMVTNEQVFGLQNEIKDLKGQMLGKVLTEKAVTEISDSLLSILLDKQGQIEKITFQHFTDLKNICSPDQQKQLQSLIHRLFPPPDRNNDRPPRQPGDLDNRPPHEQGKHRPRPNDDQDKRPPQSRRK